MSYGTKITKYSDFNSLYKEFIYNLIYQYKITIFYSYEKKIIYFKIDVSKECKNYERIKMHTLKFYDNNIHIFCNYKNRDEDKSRHKFHF